MNRITVISLLLIGIAIVVCAAQAEEGKAEKVTYQVLLSEHEIRFEHRIQLQHCFSKNINFAVVGITLQVRMLSSYDEKSGHNTYYSDEAEQLVKGAFAQSTVRIDRAPHGMLLKDRDTKRVVDTPLIFREAGMFLVSSKCRCSDTAGKTWEMASENSVLLVVRPPAK